MNRLTKAWKALRGTLEPEYVIADSAVVVTLYTVGLWGKWPKHYLTCQQAHAEHPRQDVRASKALKIGGEYYWAPYGLRRAEVQPKPKRPKGRA